MRETYPNLPNPFPNLYTPPHSHIHSKNSRPHGDLRPLSSKKWKLVLKQVVGPSLMRCALPSLPTSPLECVPPTPPHSHFLIQAKPKSLRPPSLRSHLSLGFDTWQRSKRGHFASQGINRTPPSLISHHSLEYCYATIFLPSLSLSLFILLPFHFALGELGAILLLQPLPLVIKKGFGGIVEYKIVSWCSIHMR
jgi:hypothetical protein